MANPAVVYTPAADTSALAGTYIVKTSTSAPPNAQVLASLSTGIVKVTTTTGALSTATAGTASGDYMAPFIPEWVLVEKRTLVSISTTETFSGLTGDTHFRYRWRIRAIAGAAGTSTCTLLPNGDASNGRCVDLDIAGVVGVSASTTMRIGEVTVSRSALMIGEFLCKSGSTTDMEYVGNGVRSQAAAAPIGKEYHGTYEVQNTEITSLGFKASTANGWGVGTVIELWRGGV